MMKSYTIPILKKVEPEFGSSFVLRQLINATQGEVPKWHYHPELELVFIESGNGKRIIGNNVSNYEDGDLILIGSNLPHYGFTSKSEGELEEIVLQVHESCFGVGFLDMVEMSSIKDLFERSKQGISFYGDTKSQVGERLKSMFYMTQFEKMVELIKVFHILSLSEDFDLLNAHSHTLMFKGNDLERIEVIYAYVSDHFEEKISLSDVASQVNMTVSAFCRFFKNSTSKTFVQFLNEYRVAYACRLLSEPDAVILDVAYACGFHNVSNFNRAFKKITKKSPSDFRKEKRSLIVDSSLGDQEV